jgi:hypothetical protein
MKNIFTNAISYNIIVARCHNAVEVAVKKPIWIGDNPSLCLINAAP